MDLIPSLKYRCYLAGVAHAGNTFFHDLEVDSCMSQNGAVFEKHLYPFPINVCNNSTYEKPNFEMCSVTADPLSVVPMVMKATIIMTENHNFFNGAICFLRV